MLGVRGCMHHAPLRGELLLLLLRGPAKHPETLTLSVPTSWGGWMLGVRGCMHHAPLRGELLLLLLRGPAKHPATPAVRGTRGGLGVCLQLLGA